MIHYFAQIFIQIWSVRLFRIVCLEYSYLLMNGLCAQIFMYIPFECEVPRLYWRSISFSGPGT